MDEIISGIYCIENNLNGKRYIGQSVNIKIRRIIHFSLLRNLRHYNSTLQQDWISYGEEAFSSYIIKMCEKENLDKEEIFYIKKFNSRNPLFGYNQTNGGKGLLGYSYRNTEIKYRSKQDKNLPEKIYIEKAPRIFTDEHRDKLRNSQIGKKKFGASSLYYGVKRKRNLWEAYITENGEKIHISYHKEEIEAALAYDKFIIETGRNRPLNYP